MIFYFKKIELNTILRRYGWRPLFIRLKLFLTSYKLAFDENANLFQTTHKSYEWIPLNALFPSMFLLFVKEQIIDPLEVHYTTYAN